jgi:glycosyltransferase involved in cell wall biosynthesis
MGAGSLAVLTVVEQARVPMLLTFQEQWPTYAHAWDAWSRMFAGHPWAGPLRAVLRVETRLPRLTCALTNFVSADNRSRTLANPAVPVPDGEVVHLGISTDDFPISDAAGQAWSWRLVFVGRLDHSKGILTLVRAFAQLPPEARLDLVGSGSPDVRRDVEELAAQLEVADRITFGTSTRRDLVSDTAQRTCSSSRASGRSRSGSSPSRRWPAAFR